MNTLVNVDNISSEISVFQTKETKMRSTITSPSARKEAVRRIIEGGERVADIAQEYGVSKNTVHNWKTIQNKMSEKDFLIKKLKEINEQLEGERIEILRENENLEYSLNKFKEMLRDEMKSK